MVTRLIALRPQQGCASHFLPIRTNVVARRFFSTRGLDYFSVHEPLLDLESHPAVGLSPSINTVTFFSGSSPQEAAAKLRERMAVILKANPWMVGKVIKTPKEKNMVLAHPPAEDTIPSDIMEAVVQVDTANLRIQPTMPYKDISKAVLSSSACLPNLGTSYLFKSECSEPDLVTRLTVVPDPDDQNKFALIVSMSHVVADGFTYYSFLGMLTDGSEVVELSATRSTKAGQNVKEGQGPTDAKFMLSPSFLLPTMLGAMSKRNMFSYYLDDAKVASAKAQEQKSLPDDVSFVSTNDVIVSSFSRMFSPRMMTLPMNFRGRVEHALTSLAGNYEAVLFLDAAVYSSAGAVRKLLQDGAPFASHASPLPGLWEMLTSKAPTAQVNNWAGLTKDDIVLGKAIQELHLPTLPDNPPIDICLIFRPSRGRLAVMGWSRDLTPKGILQGAPLSSESPISL